MKRRSRITFFLRPIRRWAHDVHEISTGFFLDPFSQQSGTPWSRDFGGEIEQDDYWHSAWLVVLSILPAILAAWLSHEPQWRIMAKLFGAPLQAVINGFLTCALVFMGSHLNHAQKPFPVAYKLMLRIMAMYPIVNLLTIFSWGTVAALLLYGVFVIRGVRKTYPIPFMNVLIFFGIVYTLFALFQMQALLGHSPAAIDPIALPPRS